MHECVRVCIDDHQIYVPVSDDASVTISCASPVHLLVVAGTQSVLGRPKFIIFSVKTFLRHCKINYDVLARYKVGTSKVVNIWQSVLCVKKKCCIIIKPH